jgi:hypothetical protein
MQGMTMVKSAKKTKKTGKRKGKAQRIQRAPWGRPRLYSRATKPLPILVRIPLPLPEVIDNFAMSIGEPSRPKAIRKMIALASGYKGPLR